MKIRSLLIGSATAAGLVTGAYAADATTVMSSLDVCDSLGKSGITISSDTNCLQITGGVDYRFRYGDYGFAQNAGTTFDGNEDPFADNFDPATGASRDWETRTRAWLEVVATSDSSFGPASAIIGLRQIDEWVSRNGGFGNGFTGRTAAGALIPGVPTQIPAGTPGQTVGGDSTNGVKIDEAYVSVGDSTVLMAGLRRSGAGPRDAGFGPGGSIANIQDDTPYSFSFNSDKIDGGGILIDGDDFRFGGTSLQIVSDLGNGLSAGVALENMASEGIGTDNLAAYPAAGPFLVTTVGRNSNLSNFRGNADQAGTLIGVLNYAGEGLTAHVTGIAYGVMDGTVNSYALHAGATGTFDTITVRGAVGYDSNFKYSGNSLLQALASAKVTFDMFTLAVSGDIASFGGFTDTDIGAKVSFTVTDGVTLNLDGAWFHDGSTGGDSTRIQGDVAASVTETLALTAAIGGFFGSGVISQSLDNNILYGQVGVVWAPGTGTTAGALINVNDEGGWRAQVDASKSFN